MTNGDHFVVQGSTTTYVPSSPATNIVDMTGYWCDCDDRALHQFGDFVLYTDQGKAKMLYQQGWNAGYDAGYEEAAEDLDPDGAIRAGYGVD